MNEIVSEWYSWIKAFHIIAVIAWMAGILYLPRLFVYHANVDAGSELSEIFKIMEQRLLRFIITPAMFLSLIFGIVLILIPGLIDFSEKWFWVKLGCAVVGLGVNHIYLIKWSRAFSEDRNVHTASFYRKINEVPTAFMIVIVIMVVVKPF